MAVVAEGNWPEGPDEDQLAGGQFMTRYEEPSWEEVLKAAVHNLHGTYLIVHQDTTFTLAILHRTLRVIVLLPPFLLETDGPGSHFWVGMSSSHRLLRGEVDTEAAVPIFAGVQHHGSIGIFRLSEKRF